MCAICVWGCQKRKEEETKARAKVAEESAKVGHIIHIQTDIQRPSHTEDRDRGAHTATDKHTLVPCSTSQPVMRL